MGGKHVHKENGDPRKMTNINAQFIMDEWVLVGDCVDFRASGRD